MYKLMKSMGGRLTFVSLPYMIELHNAHQHI